MLACLKMQNVFEIHVPLRSPKFSFLNAHGIHFFENCMLSLSLNFPGTYNIAPCTLCNAGTYSTGTGLLT